jgi:hypothetical protein
MAETQNPKADWWAAFPAAKAKCDAISTEALMKMFDDMDIKPGPRPFLVVDVRRNDWEVRDHFRVIDGYQNLSPPQLIDLNDSNL